LAVTDADAFSQQLASFHATVDAVFVEYVRHVIEIGALGQFLFVFSYHVIGLLPLFITIEAAKTYSSNVRGHRSKIELTFRLDIWLRENFCDRQYQHR
tara:strand:+ start:388 stop:681 length:294 start_codon:yes stop_codon:yes gene_type:complete